MDPEESSYLLEKYPLESANGKRQIKNTLDKRRKTRGICLSVALIASVVVNLALSSYVISNIAHTNDITKYAGLDWNQVDPYYDITPYGSDNDTLVHDLWNDIDVDDGVVALTDSDAHQWGLPRAQRFPWDKNKGVYILHGFHNLHCLKIVHIALSEYRLGLEQTRAWPHISHCLDALRRQIICDADDTPRAVLEEFDGISGYYQHRSCRSFDQLRQFAQQHTACYKRPEKPIHDMPHIELYKHCPEGAGYDNVPNSTWY